MCGHVIGREDPSHSGIPGLLQRAHPWDLSCIPAFFQAIRVPERDDKGHHSHAVIHTIPDNRADLIDSVRQQGSFCW